MKYAFTIFLSIYLISCHPTAAQSGTADVQNIKADISKMTDSLEQDLFRSGPLAWITYFDQNPGFFMVSDGQMVFKDYYAGKDFIEKTLITKISKIRLTLDHLEVQPLTPGFASLAAHFHEDLTDLHGTTSSINGYVTAVLEKTDRGWKFLNLHWSSQS
jgi:hypothetical protein